MGRKGIILELKAADRSELKSFVRKGEGKKRAVLRALALLKLDEGKLCRDVCKELDVSGDMVTRVKKRYMEGGLKAVLEERPRSGRPVGIDGVQRAKVTALACSEPPEGRAKWSLQLLADKVVELGYCEGLSKSHVRRILKKTNSVPTSKNNGA